MPKTVTAEKIEAAKLRLLNLPQKPKPTKPLLLTDAVRQMKAEVQAAIKRGYTFAEISQAMRDDGIEIGAPTLKAYMLKSSRRRQKPGTKTAKAKPSTKITAKENAPKEPTWKKAVEMPTEL